MTTPPKKILIIEDEVPVQQLLKRLLTRLNCDATTTSDGQKAMDILAENASEYSLVITDLILPNCTGWEFLTHLKENVLYNHIKTIVISGVDASGEEQKRLLKLTNHIIPKSEFSISVFEETLKELGQIT